MKKEVAEFIDMLKYKFKVEVDSFARPHEEEPAVQVKLLKRFVGVDPWDLRAADWCFISSAAAYSGVDFNIVMIEEGIWINVISEDV